MRAWLEKIGGWRSDIGGEGRVLSISDSPGPSAVRCGVVRCGAMPVRVDKGVVRELSTRGGDKTFAIIAFFGVWELKV